jgi:hypothetical protein
MEEEPMPGDASTRIRMYSPSLDVMIRDVMRTLGNIDFEHALEVDKVERSTAADELKQDVREKLTAAHRERRQPYVELLNQLWMQQRGQSFAA